MSQEKPLQLFTVSGSQLSGIQIAGQAGGNIIQSQQTINKNELERKLTVPEVVQLITELQGFFQTLPLQETERAEAVQHLEFAKKEIQEKEPDKNYVTKSLQNAFRVLKVVKEVNEATGADQGLWQKVELTVKWVAPWLGVAVKTLLPF